MEKITGWFQEVFSRIHLNLDVSMFHPFDWFFLVFLVLGLVYGIKKGFLRCSVELLEFLLVIFTVVGNYEWLSRQLIHFIPKLSLEASKPIAYFMILSTVWASVMVIDHNLKNLVQAKTFPPLKYVGGALLGVLYFFLIFALVCKGLSLLPWQLVAKLFNVGVTQFGNMLADTPIQMYTVMMKKISALVSTK